MNNTWHWGRKLGSLFKTGFWLANDYEGPTGRKIFGFGYYSAPMTTRKYRWELGFCYGRGVVTLIIQKDPIP